MKKSSAVTVSQRMAVGSRVLAALIGGYVFTSATVVLVSVLWPGSMAQGVFWATMLSFLLYAAAVIWTFTARTATRAWAGLLGAALACAALAWLLRQGA